MSSGKFSVSIIAVLVAMVLVCHMSSAANLVASSSAVNETGNSTLVNKPGFPDVAPVALSNNHQNASSSHLKTRGIGGAVAGGVASGAAMTLIGGLLGGRV